MSVYLGFYLGHDSNVAVSVDGKVRYRKSERHFGEKHHKANLNFIVKTLGDWGLSLADVDFCAYTDGNRNKLGECPKRELFCKGSIQGVKSYCLDHHYAHVLSSWPIIDTKKLHFGISLDGRGDHNRTCRIIKNPSNPEVIFEEYGPGMGIEFYNLGTLLGFKGLEYDFAGKLMGLQSYSEEAVKQFGLPGFEQLDWTKLEKGNYTTYSEWHEFWWEYIKKLFGRFKKTDFVSYSGGCAQNTVYNYRLKKLFPNLFIPPHCYDGGLSLGCLEFLRLFFGESKLDASGFPYWQDDKIEEQPNEKTLTTAARMLAAGKIVGWAQGRAAIGPRALGNRSIIMNVEKGENKDILNHRVKKREPWRPYAGVVLEEFAREYFDLPQSKHMLYACQVLSDKIPAVTHVDRSCRMQTISPKDNEFFYRLVFEYYKLTGLPVLLNTSLNVMGNPIVSWKKQTSKIDGLDAMFWGNKNLRYKIF